VYAICWSVYYLCYWLFQDGKCLVLLISVLSRTAIPCTILLTDTHMQNTLWFVTGGNLCERDQKSHKFFQRVNILMLHMCMLYLHGLELCLFFCNGLVDGWNKYAEMWHTFVLSLWYIDWCRVHWIVSFLSSVHVCMSHNWMS
jgi:hypothetical protein